MAGFSGPTFGAVKGYINSGSGSNTPILVGIVKRGDSFPTKRPDGSALVLGDYVKPKASENFPFEISGQVFNNSKDQCVWVDSEWQMNVSAFQYTSETPIKNKTNESIDGQGKYQSGLNIKVANIIGKNKTLDVSDKTTLIEALNYILGTKETTDKDKVWKVNNLGKFDLTNIKEWKIVNTFDGEVGNDYTLYILTEDVTIAGVDYKKGFYTWDSVNGYTMRSSSVKVFTDVQTLPAIDISNQTIYRINASSSEIYKHNGEIVNIENMYKIKDQRLSCNVNGITWDDGEDFWEYSWNQAEDIYYAIHDFLLINNYISIVDNLDNADFCGYEYDYNIWHDFHENFTYEEGENKYDLYFNPTQTSDGYIKINTKVFTDVETLPSSNISSQTIYRIIEYKYEHNDVEIDEPQGYRALIEEFVITETGIADGEEEFAWENVSDELVADWLDNNKIEQCDFDDAEFFSYQEEVEGVVTAGYDYKDNFEKKQVYNLYHNPTETAGRTNYKLINGGGNGGGSANVEIDEVTITKNDQDEIQANAIIDCGTTLPISNIKQNVYYKKTETTPVEMVKLFTYDGTNWKSVSTIELPTLEDYDELTNEQKTDGTMYVINGTGGMVTQWIYSTLQGKPTIAGITIVGNLTLEDLHLYSRDEVNALLANKGSAEFVNQLPTPLVKNVWYYSKKYADGTDVPSDKRALYIEDKNDVLQYLGVVGDVDLSNYYTKAETDTLLNDKQNSLSLTQQNNDPTDTDNLTDIIPDNPTQCKRWTFGKIWNWVKSKADDIYAPRSSVFNAGESGSFISPDLAIFNFERTGTALRQRGQKQFFISITNPVTGSGILYMECETTICVNNYGTAGLTAIEQIAKSFDKSGITLRRTGTISGIIDATAITSATITWKEWYPLEYPPVRFNSSYGSNNYWSISGGTCVVTLVSANDGRALDYTFPSSVKPIYRVSAAVWCYDAPIANNKTPFAIIEPQNRTMQGYLIPSSAGNIGCNISFKIGY